VSAPGEAAGEVGRAEPAWLTAEEARRYLRVGESELYRWLNGGAYPVGVVVRIGKTWRISRAWLEGRTPIAGLAAYRDEPIVQPPVRAAPAVQAGHERVQDGDRRERALAPTRRRGQAW
jgi:hypothetical protein